MGHPSVKAGHDHKKLTKNILHYPKGVRGTDYFRMIFKDFPLYRLHDQTSIK